MSTRPIMLTLDQVVDAMDIIGSNESLRRTIALIIYQNGGYITLSPETLRNFDARKRVRVEYDPCTEFVTFSLIEPEETTP